MKLLPLLFLITSSTVVLAQAAPSSVKTDALELLQRVSQHYADAKSYRIEAIEERESHNDLSRDWQKTFLEAAETSGNKFRYVGRYAFGNAQSISDGKQIWNYRVEQNTYTLLAKLYHSATMLPEAKLDLSGRQIRCYVVRLTTDDATRKQPGLTFEETIWIDEANDTIAKRVEHAHTFTINGASKIPIETETTTTYSLMELDQTIPDSFFSFTPPGDATLVDHFPDPMNPGSWLEGHMLPRLKLTATDGKTTSTDDLRGKYVVLDFWATRCAPCEKNLEKLAPLYQQTKDKGLVLITIDQDADSETARSYLAKKGYDWPNIHDDGRIMQAIGNSGIPRTLVINHDGKVVYDGSGEIGDEKLRAAIAKLGPEFASIAPKTSTPPCENQISSSIQ